MKRISLFSRALELLTSRWVVVYLLLLPGSAICSFMGCDSKDNPTGIFPTFSPSVTVSPEYVDLPPGDTLQFQATLRELPPGVTWHLTPDDSQTDSLGTITGRGFYTAPVRWAGEHDYMVRVTATSVANPLLTGVGYVYIRHVRTSISPDNVLQALPGRPKIFSIKMSPARGVLKIFVDDIEGGNDEVGTISYVTDTTYSYTPPVSVEQLTTHTIRAVSTEESAIPDSASITVLAGYRVYTPPDTRPYVPEWSPTADRIAYMEGPAPYRLVVKDVPFGDTRYLAENLDWEGKHRGRLSWSRDGTKIAYLERVSDSHVVRVIDETGTIQMTLHSSQGTEYRSPRFLPSAGSEPESLLVIANSGEHSELRLFSASEPDTGLGRLIYEAAARSTISWPDVIRVGGEFWVTAIITTFIGRQIVVLVDDRVGPAVLTETLGGPSIGSASHLHWAAHEGSHWINALSTWETFFFTLSEIYRVQINRTPSWELLYAGGYVNAGADVSPVAPLRHVFSHHDSLWVLDYPAAQ